MEEVEGGREGGGRRRGDGRADVADEALWLLQVDKSCGMLLVGG